MYQISIYDASQTFRLIPNGERYSLTLWANNTVKFTSKRKAFDFIGKVSGLISEALAICEMVHNNVNSFSFHLKANLALIRIRLMFSLKILNPLLYTLEI